MSNFIYCFVNSVIFPVLPCIVLANLYHNIVDVNNKYGFSAVYMVRKLAVVTSIWFGGILIW